MDPNDNDLLPINNDDNYGRAISTARPVLRVIVQRKGRCFVDSFSMHIVPLSERRVVTSFNRVNARLLRNEEMKMKLLQWFFVLFLFALRIGDSIEEITGYGTMKPRNIISSILGQTPVKTKSLAISNPHDFRQVNWMKFGLRHQ